MKTTRTFNEYEIDCPIMGFPMVFDHWAEANELLAKCEKEGHEVKIRVRNVIEVVQATDWKDVTHIPSPLRRNRNENSN